MSFLGYIYALCLCASVVQAATLPQIPAAPTNLVLVSPTNKPVEVHFSEWPKWFSHTTNLSRAVTTIVTDSFRTNGSIEYLSNATLTVTAVERQRWPVVTNLLVACSLGTNRETAMLATNFFAALVTNRGPVRFWLPTTNRYVISLFALTSDRQRLIWAQSDWPAAPSNQVRFIVTPIFSQNLRDWTAGTNNYTFTITNAVGFGTNQFVRWSAAAVKDDFTPKAVVFDQNTIQITK